MKYNLLPDYAGILEVVRSCNPYVASQVLAYAQAVASRTEGSTVVYRPDEDASPRVSLGYSCIWFDWVEVSDDMYDLFFAVGAEGSKYSHVTITPLIDRAIEVAKRLNEELLSAANEAASFYEGEENLPM